MYLKIIVDKYQQSLSTDEKLRKDTLCLCTYCKVVGLLSGGLMIRYILRAPLLMMINEERLLSTIIFRYMVFRS